MPTVICQHCGKSFQTPKNKRKFCSELCSNKAHGRDQLTRLYAKPQVNVLSYGGGVDSTAIALLILQEKLERPDYIVMVDTGYEKASTWKYINEVVQPKLTKANIPITIIHTNDYSSNALIDRNGMVVIPAHYRREDGKVGKMRTWCNGGWKAKVANRWMRDKGIQRAQQWIGFSADEERRKLVSNVKWIEYRYPLIELGYDRNTCIYQLGQAGWPMPPRTSCYFCPQQTNRQWQELAKHEPEEFARAVAIERQLQQHNPNIYLHQSCVKLDNYIKKEKPQRPIL